MSWCSTMLETSSSVSQQDEVPEGIVSQRDYKPTPFQSARWEVVGERMSEDKKHFAPMNFEILKAEEYAVDPMFAMFDEAESASSGYGWGESEGVLSGLSDALSPEQRAQELAAKFEEGQALGYQKGLEEAERLAAEKKKELEGQLSKLFSEVEEKVNASLLQMEQEALKFSLNIAKKILETTAEIKPDYIIDVIRQGLHSIGAAKPLRIRVAEQDFEFLEVIGLPPELSKEELGVQYVADPSIKSGCIIETDFGEIDLQLEEMWEKIKSQLYETVR